MRTNCKPSKVETFFMFAIIEKKIIQNLSFVTSVFVSAICHEQIRLYRKYHKLIKKCEKLSPENLSLLIKLADALEEK